MREIKCKAFRKDSRETGEVLSIDVENGRAKIEFYTKENEYYHIVCELKDENIAIRWYTGLKDKNGTEIYEGDIISSIYGTFNNTGMGIAQAYKGMYVSFYGQDTIGRNQFDELHTVCDSREVIGNIYENPELLEGESGA